MRRFVVLVNVRNRGRSIVAQPQARHLPEDGRTTLGTTRVARLRYVRDRVVDSILVDLD